ncbi:hypothetical protein ACHAWC_006340 [Mediolabrus comicus]
MRIITGDECGLLKEVIPELSRPPPTTDVNNSDGAAATAIHVGKARPSATSIQAAAAAQMQHGSGVSGGGGFVSSSAVRRIEHNHGEGMQSRERGVISMTFVPSQQLDDDTSSSFQFATLRMNGVVQLWSGSRSSDDDEAEGHITPATYRQIGVCQNVFQDITTKKKKSRDTDDDDEEENENDVSSSFADKDGSSNNNTAATVTGWNAHQPIRPIAMVSSCRHDMTTATNTANSNNNPILACADSLGNISLLNSHKLQKGVVQTYNAFDLSTNQIINSQTISSTANNSGTNNNTAILTYTKGRYSNTSICTAIEICHDGERLAVGGRERGVRLLDLESGKLVWKAKNLPPDPQTLLQQPQWTTAIQEIHHGSSDGVTNLLATGTAYKQVQIYDIRTSSTTRRPVLYTPEGNLFEHRITSLCQLHDNHTLAIGDSIGDCHLIDMRKMHSGKQYSARKQHAKEEIGLGRLVGPGGSIRTLVRHPSLPYLACVGLDRKLWTWDVSKRKMMDCVYLKQRLNCALFCGDDSWNGADNNDNDIDGEENGDNYDGEVDYIQDEEWNNKRERELEKDHQDEVEDYIDSDDDNDGDAQDSGETASDSEDGDDDDDSSEGSSSSSSNEEEEEERAHRMKQKRGKRQKV